MNDIAPEAPPGPEPSQAAPRVPFPRPADYYSAPVTARPVVAAWVPYGCGWAAIALLLIIFAAGAVLSHGGMGSLLDLFLGSIQGEVGQMFTKDVTPAEKTEFDAQMNSLREHVRQNKIPLERLQPLLRSVRDVSSDQHVTPAETEQLIHEIEAVNKTAKP